MSKVVIITGPESTGKTELCKRLAKHYNTTYIPEYARTFLEHEARPYTFDDVIHIAQEQLEQMHRIEEQEQDKPVFFDTYLIITKKWFEIVYHHYPDWIDESIRQTGKYIYLLCYPDLEWQPDPLRENGGEMRMFLYREYMKELEKFELKYFIVKGTNQQRTDNAINYLNKYI